ncbi:MAG: tetratricopeptide repeat protein [bacterium]
MRRRNRPILPPLLLYLACCYHSSDAQDSLSQAWSAFYRGDYPAALRVFQQAAENSTQHTAAIAGQSLALQELGRYAEARALLINSRKDTSDARLLQRLGELELLLGHIKTAQRYFDDAVRLAPAYRPALFYQAMTRWHLGERTAAHRTFQSFLDFYRTAPSLTAQDIHLVARACVYLERFHDANRLFGEAVKQQPGDWTLYLPWGDLFLEKYNLADARSIFSDALKQNQNCAPARLGLAQVQSTEDFEQALRTAEYALQLNPHSPRSRTVLAELHLFANHENEAQAELTKVLQEFREYIPALALQAVLADRRQDQTRIAEIIAQAAAANPKDAAVYVRLGEDAARRYLFQEAAGYFRRGLAVDSEDWNAAAGLGTSLSRLGQKDEARIHLDRAFEHDPFNVVVGNLLNLFDEMVKYDTLRTQHFIIRMRPEDKVVIGTTAAGLCEAAYQNMAPRYRANFTAPVTVEIFPRHDDFAVRCFGLPGAEFFLGICFGPLIAMNSPRGRERGAFNWQETLWHEIAHVVHLQLTANCIPRWFAEGLAVYEAAHARSEWSMNMDLPMIRALQNDELLPLHELDEGFTRRPEMVSLVYFQASQIIEFIAERYGFEKVLALLPHFRQGKKTEETISLVFAQSAEEFDRAFHEFLRQRFHPETLVIAGAKSSSLAKIFGNMQSSAEKETGGDLRGRAESEPRDFLAALRYGNHLAKTGQAAEAEIYLTRAKNLLPAYVDEGNPYSALAALFWQQGRKKEAAAELEFLTARNGRAVNEAVQLGEWQLSLHDSVAAARAWSRALAIYPFDAGLQRRVGEFHLTFKQPAAAEQNFRAALGLNPADRAALFCLLAEASLAQGRHAQAKKQALEALELAPNFERAQEILLQIVE